MQLPPAIRNFPLSCTSFIRRRSEVDLPVQVTTQRRYERLFGLEPGELRTHVVEICVVHGACIG
jgi:hypothetical protein